MHDTANSRFISINKNCLAMNFPIIAEVQMLQQMRSPISLTRFISEGTVLR
ncbi:hypothetical protein AXF42_Ash008623 [Apostasia shenzhenica]|uniref:Uncharacterized protein n=1 Tax=Apostasia shenzhenica TaxID=1088818 RepID=A0A2I0B1Y7_9ASPA|nr:hypothetical protein AXF42_Ash008623 [Apostasia shenzhenica]